MKMLEMMKTKMRYDEVVDVCMVGVVMKMVKYCRC